MRGNPRNLPKRIHGHRIDAWWNYLWKSPWVQNSYHILWMLCNVCQFYWLSVSWQFKACWFIQLLSSCWSSGSRRLRQVQGKYCAKEMGFPNLNSVEMQGQLQRLPMLCLRWRKSRNIWSNKKIREDACPWGFWNKVWMMSKSAIDKEGILVSDR